MMFNRLVAVLIVRDNTVVQSVGFEHTNIIHDKPAIAIEHFCKWAVDEITIVDVSREKRDRRQFLDLVSEITTECFVPVTVGGWIADEADMEAAMNAGADKLLINSAAHRDPDLISRGARKYGSQCMVVGVDARRDPELGHRVYVNQSATPIPHHPADIARKMVSAGAGEIFLSSIDNDGSRQGYDLALTKAVVDAVSVPVVAFGGASEWHHLEAGLRETGASAVALANQLHYVDNSARKAKKYLKKAGLHVR